MARQWRKYDRAWLSALATGRAFKHPDVRLSAVRRTSVDERSCPLLSGPRLPTKRAIRALPINLSSRIAGLAEQARPCLLRPRALVNRLFYQRERGSKTHRLFVKLREP